MSELKEAETRHNPDGGQLQHSGPRTLKMTQARINEVCKWISSGWTKDRIEDYIVENWGLSERQASRYVYSALNRLVPDDPEFRQGLIQKNIARLEKMIEEAMEEGDRRTANECIKTLNQMSGISGNKVTIGNRDEGGNQQVIEITFD